MNRTALLALIAVVALSACGSGASTAGAPPPNDSLRSSSTVKAAPYEVPVVTSPAVQDAERRAKAKMRSPKDSYGGVPTFSGSVAFIDAPNFGPGAQVNLAIAGVQAVSGGTSYSLVSYDQPVVINALNYQHSSLSLGSNTIPAIMYDGFTLLVDQSHSSVVVDGQTYAVRFGTFDSVSHAFSAGSGGTAGVFISMPFDGSKVVDGRFMIDFAAIDSIALVNGVAEIGPTLHGVTVTGSAVISGAVVNAAGAAVSSAVVRAIAADGSVAAMTETALDGTFELHAMASGNYQVVVSNSFVTKANQTIVSQNADRTDALNAVPASVPAGYRVDLGRIQD